MKQFLYLICILLIASSCKEIYEVPPRSLLQATITNDTTQLKMTSKVTVKGIGRDSLWISDTSVSLISIPLSTKLPLSTMDTTSYIVSFDSRVDTISFIHTSIQKYASMETGFYYEYELKSIKSTHHRILSIDITDSLVTTIWHENIKINILPLPVGGN